MHISTKFSLLLSMTHLLVSNSKVILCVSKIVNCFLFELTWQNKITLVDPWKRTTITATFVVFSGRPVSVYSDHIWIIFKFDGHTYNI